MTQCLISLGANLGDPRESIRLAAEKLVKRLGPGKVSSYYHTPPVGGPSGQPPFVNAVVWVDTELNAWETWTVVRQVENELGRVRLERWEARRIDVDILLFGDHRVWTPQLKIPHPRMCMRRFILVPAVEVAPEVRDPATGSTVAELASALNTRQTIVAVIGSRVGSTMTILEEAARLTGARLVQSNSQTAQPSGRTLRYLCDVCLEEVEELPSSNLVIHLTPPIAVEGALWEDYYRRAAELLNLSEFASQTQERTRHKISGAGARYLLASDTPSWASHEIVAAFQAIDCPVEKLP